MEEFYAIRAETYAYLITGYNDIMVMITKKESNK